MIDWPNLLFGFVLGVAGTVPFWLADRRRARRVMEAEWTRAAHRLEVVMFRPTTTSTEMQEVIDEYPIDLWREHLGPADFRVLEALMRAYWSAEHAVREYQGGVADERMRTLKDLNDAQVAFANMARARARSEYTEVIRRESGDQVWRHPLRAARHRMRQ